MNIAGYVMTSLSHSLQKQFSEYQMYEVTIWPETLQNTVSLYTDIQTPQTCLGLTLYLHKYHSSTI